MRAHRLILLVTLLFSTVSYAQVEWVEHPIVTGYDGAWGIFAIDMDGDQDIDLVTSAYEAHQITWWENDGYQNFLEHNIDSNLDRAANVNAGDLDGDGDMDVISVSSRGDEIAWYENNGQTGFTKYILVQNYDGPLFACMYDLDHDNDMDVVAGNYYAGNVTWWENIGYPTFARHDIDSTFGGCRQVDVWDLDNDGDEDILASAETVHQIAWYENDGNEVFQKHVVQYGYIAFWAKPYDFNGDGAWDILGCSGGYNDDISWFENDGNMNFSMHNIDSSVDDPQSVEAADFDLDGDLDIVCADRHNHEIAWWENQNNTVFIKNTINSDLLYPVTVFPVDMETDGDWDIIATAYTADRVTWWENRLVFIPGIITGIVSDENSVPVESVFVHASETDVSDYTDTDGQYELALSGGTYDIEFQKSGYYDNIVYDILIDPADTATIDVFLFGIPWPCSSCVRGLVTNRESIEIESVYVSAIGTGIDDYTNFAGRYSLEGLPAGNQDVSFFHPNYSDTIVTGVFSTPDSGTILDMLIESNSAITGVVVDTNSQPISGVAVNIFDIDLETSTDSLGEFILAGLVPGFPYDVSFNNIEFQEYIEENVTTGANDTVSLGTVVLEPMVFDVIVWIGNVDLTPITAPIGATIQVDVYVQTVPNLNFMFLHLPLGTNDQYIVDNHSSDEGILYYPLTEWDDVSFYQPSVLSPGWHNQTLLGFSDLWPPPNPYLSCLEPTRIASYALEIADDSSLIGSTVDCFMEGYDPANGGPLFGDSTGVIPYYPYQLYSPLVFTEPASGGCEYVTGDANNSGDYNGLDITFGVSYFKGGPVPPYECECTPGHTWYVSGDVNSTCDYNGIDITYGVAFLKGGPAPTPCGDCPPTAVVAGKEKTAIPALKK